MSLWVVLATEDSPRFVRDQMGHASIDGTEGHLRAPRARAARAASRPRPDPGVGGCGGKAYISRGRSRRCFIE